MTASPLLVLVTLALVFEIRAQPQQFSFTVFEECFLEPASSLVTVEAASLRVVQSPNHRLGFQVSVNLTVHADSAWNDPLVTNLRVWNAESGDRYKYGDQDACCSFVLHDQGQCREEGSPTHCPLSEGRKSGMIERLFAEERAGSFEAQLQLLQVFSDNREELVCIAIPFTISEEFLTQFQQERREKRGPQPHSQPILLL